MRAIPAAMMLIFAVSSTQAATYKCQDAHGNWTEQACPDYQQRMGEKAWHAEQQIDQSAQPPTKSTADSVPTPKKNAAIQAISDETADYDCRSAAHGLVIIPDTTDIDRMKAQAEALENSHYVNARTGVVNAHSQDMEQADRIRAASLRAAIAIEEQKNANVETQSRRAEQAALAKCDIEKATRDKARNDQ